MTRLASIQAVNVKSPAFRYDLSAVNVVTGPNYGFKTAILQAVQLALLGYVPSLPKTNAGIFSLSCGQAMEVEARLTDGKVLTRSFVQKGGTIKASHLVPDKFVVPDVLLDATEYLRLSDRERIKYVFGLVDNGDKWSGEAILRVVGETPIDCDKALVEAVVLAKKSVMDRLSESDMERYDSGGSVQEWLEKSAEDLRERVRNSNAALQRMEKFSQASVELRSNGNGVSAENVDRLLRDKRQALQEASNALAVAKASQETARRNEATRKELVHRLSEPFDAKAIDSTRKQISDLEAAQTERVDLGDLAFKVAEARGQLEAARNQHKNVMAELESVAAKHEMDLKSPKCPHCGTGGKKFKAAVKKQFESHNKELMAAKTKTESEIATAQAAYGAVQGAYEIAAIADKKAERDKLLLQSLKAEVLRLETLACNRATWKKQLDGLTDAQAPTDADMFELNKTVALLNTEANDLNERRTRWIAQAHEQKRMSEARTQRQSLEAELIALKSIVKSVELIQSEMVKSAFGKILGDCNKFCEGILLSRLDYHDGEIGRWNGSSWVPHRSFSGTESLISCASISAALARQSPIRIILLDELGRLVRENKIQLMERLLALTAEGFIDQVVCVDVTDDPYKSIPGVNLISV